MKQGLLEKTSIFLLKEGFTIKSLTRTCFDILARKDALILLIKVLEDANSITPEYTDQMSRVSSYINASPLIIAEKAAERLRDNVVYSRFGVSTLTFDTFVNALHNKMPFLKSDHAGLKANLLGSKLRERIEAENISIGALAKKIGVSKRMVQKYQDGQSEVTVQKAFRIYDIFGNTVFDKVNIFNSGRQIGEGKTNDITRKFSELGFDALETKKTPFDVIAKKDKEIVLTEVGDKSTAQLQSLSRLLDADHLVLFDKKKPEEKGIPAMTKEEFMEFHKAKELIKFLKEFEQ